MGVTSFYSYQDTGTHFDLFLFLSVSFISISSGFTIVYILRGLPSQLSARAQFVVKNSGFVVKNSGIEILEQSSTEKIYDSFGIQNLHAINKNFTGVEYALLAFDYDTETVIIGHLNFLSSAEVRQIIALIHQHFPEYRDS